MDEDEINRFVGLPPGLRVKKTRISWDEFLRRVQSLPVDDQRKIVGKAAEVVAVAKPK